MKTDSEKHNAIEKALTILNIFSSHNHELSTNEISLMLYYHKATISRTLLLLAKYGFLEQNRENKKFKLGPSIAILSSSLYRSLESELIQLARPYLEKLKDSIQETVVLEVLSGRTTVRAYSVEGPGPLHLIGTIGARLPIHATAGSKAILAHLDPKTWDYFLDNDLPRRTASTITDLDQYKKELRKAKTDGIAFDMEELDPDICAMAAPVFNAEGTPIAAVVVATLAGHLKRDTNSRKAVQLKKTAENISKHIKKTAEIS